MVEMENEEDIKGYVGLELMKKMEVDKKKEEREEKERERAENKT